MPEKPTYEELEQRVRQLEANRKLRERCNLDRLIEDIRAGVVVHGSNGTVIQCNKAAQTMLNFTQDRMIGKELIDSDWKFLREDGSLMPVEEYPVSRVFETKNPIYNLVDK